MKTFRKDEEAVSPVIGVILMVAITVILAAVIGAFVFGMGSNIKKQYFVSAVATEVYDGANFDITVTYNGGPDADQVLWINVTRAGTNTTGISWKNPSTGKTITFENAGTSGKNDVVIVTAEFTDGTTQTILNTYV